MYPQLLLLKIPSEPNLSSTEKLILICAERTNRAALCRTSVIEIEQALIERSSDEA